MTILARTCLKNVLYWLQFFQFLVGAKPLQIKDWNNLRYLLALHEGGTMKRAGELLNTSATTVSRHIHALSKECGEMLAQPTKGEAWSLTPYALQLIDVAERFFDQLSQLKETGNEETRQISITSLDFVLTYYIAPALKDARAALPGVKFSLLSSDRRLSLAFGEADIALRFGRPQEGHLLSKKIATLPFRIWRNTRNDTTDWVGMSEDLDWTPDMQLAFSTFRKPPAVRTTSYAAAKRAAVALGFNTIGPDTVFADSKTLIQNDDVGCADRELWRIIHESRRLDATVQAYKDWVDALFE